MGHNGSLSKTGRPGWKLLELSTYQSLWGTMEPITNKPLALSLSKSEGSRSKSCVCWEKGAEYLGPSSFRMLQKYTRSDSIEEQSVQVWLQATLAYWSAATQPFESLSAVAYCLTGSWLQLALFRRFNDVGPRCLNPVRPTKRSVRMNSSKLLEE